MLYDPLKFIYPSLNEFESFTLSSFRVVRELAIKNGDVSHPNPYILPPKKKVVKNDTEKSPVVFLEQSKRIVREKHSSHRCVHVEYAYTDINYVCHHFFRCYIRDINLVRIF